MAAVSYKPFVDIQFSFGAGTVNTLYNVTRYNRIFSIRRKFAGNGSVYIKIPSS